MRVFWLRLTLFSLLWIIEITVNSTFLPVSISFFTLGLGLYFLLSISHLSYQPRGLLPQKLDRILGGR